MVINRQGCTRIVILTKRYAIKVPNFLDGYRMLLAGLSANFEERLWSKYYKSNVCPVLCGLPFGWVIVMPRVRVLTDDEFLSSDIVSHPDFPTKALICSNGCFLTVENKSNSFGWLNGKVVCIDYGS